MYSFFNGYTSLENKHRRTVITKYKKRIHSEISPVVNGNISKKLKASKTEYLEGSINIGYFTVDQDS